MRIVVCDTGPVLHLSEAGALNLLEKAGEVLLPPIVDREVGVARTIMKRSSCAMFADRVT